MIKTALFHSIIQSVPLDIKTSTFLFRNFHSALGVININFSDQRRTYNYLSLNVSPDEKQPQLIIHYAVEKDEKRRIKSVLKKMSRAFIKLGCLTLPGMAHIRPIGASVHYAGTLPMSKVKASY